ncbi:SipW-dependent-type signal peptide-containing protein [Desulfitobacterium sp. THU1]|uniref:SipW-dependent-type signal peptide-containing protein n=1 Tax=Desulfitobacterium sp. THU1 TaxID=3138072 RepID=UPI00311F3D33
MKKKLIALTLAASVMLTGAGYAYWTDQVTINNSVSTGEFDVNFVDDQFYPKIFGATGEAYITKSVVQNDENTSTVAISNLYPGSTVRYELKIRNDGSIPALFDNAVVTVTENQQGFTDALLTQVFVKKYHADGTAYVQGENGYWAGASLGWKPASALQTNLNTIMAGLRLEPGEFVTFDVPDEYMEEYLAQNPDGAEGQCVEIKLPGTVGNAANPDQFEKAEAYINMTINWKQHNAQ